MEESQQNQQGGLDAGTFPTRHDIEHWLGRQDCAAMRQHLESAPLDARDKMRRTLQDASQSAVIDPAVDEDMAMLVGLPVVIGYRGRCETVPQALLVRPCDCQLARRLQGMWAALMPGRTVAAMPVAVRLDVALAADPADVRDCAEQAAALLDLDGDGQHSFRAADGLQPDWAVTPIPAVFLVLAAVRYRSIDGPPSFDRNEPMGLRVAAGLMRGIFATRDESPHVAVSMPQPFFKAGERALAGQLRYMTDPAANGAPQLGRLKLNVIHSAASCNATITLRGEDEDGGERDADVMKWRYKWEWRTAAGLAAVIDEVRAADDEEPIWVEFAGVQNEGLPH